MRKCLVVLLTLFCFALLLGCPTPNTTTSATNHSPNAPSEPTPAITATGIGLTPTLKWSCTDPDNDPLTYDVYLDTSTSPSTKLNSSALSSADFTINNPLTVSTLYYWKVVASDGKATTSSAVWNFTTQPDTTAPAEVTNLTAAASASQITLTWVDPADADFTHVEITWTPDESTIQSINKGIQLYKASGLTTGQRYTFTVQSVDSAGNRSTGTSLTWGCANALSYVGGTTGWSGFTQINILGGGNVSAAGSAVTVTTQTYPIGAAASVHLFWSTDGSNWTDVTMVFNQLVGNNEQWSGLIPSQVAGTTVYFYILAAGYTGVILYDANGGSNFRYNIIP